ncbi:hypothetical protein ACMHYJ_00030 [Castellaniella hirudinis]|uniref:hypothetical protein n=1 Tax=Castellaniella hirudinis TaxID=1144617 RepID=UPI0039C28FFE
MTAPVYPYASGNLLENRNTYFYAAFGGRAFLQAWQRQRTAALAACHANPYAATAREDPAPIVQALRRLQCALHLPECPAETWDTLDHVLQRFEVSKRLHDDYTRTWRPKDPMHYHGLERYLLLAEVLGQATALTTDLRYLSGLLKCVDTLTADGMVPMTKHISSMRLGAILDQERTLVDQVAKRPRPHLAPADLPIVSKPRTTPTMLRGIGLIAAPTARSQAYIQTLEANGLYPEFVLLLGKHTAPDFPSNALSSPLRHGIALVNPDESVITTCRRAGIHTRAVEAASINDAPAMDAIRQLRPHTLIYSGAGGQIVSPEALGLGARFLHMHAGRIPDYRGSTTIYYALLNGAPPTVTAIFLDAQIDTGGILARYDYPVPDQGIDVDQIYDASIRADTLARLLHDYASTGSFPSPQPQQPDEGSSYFVIHPVLKHLAILGLPIQNHD